MIKKTFLFLATALCVICAHAGAFPETSTDDNVKWYLIQFVNGGNAFTAENDGSNITTSTATGSDAQLWKITGDATNGYVLTNKKGYTLYSASAAKNQMIAASSSASGSYKFAINATGYSSYAGNYEIQPLTNTAISMNLWGGPSENRGVGLWDANNDQNNPVMFVSETEFTSLGAISIIPYPASLEITKEGALDFTTLTSISYPDEECKQMVENFAAQLLTASGINLAVEASEATAKDAQIWLSLDSNEPLDGYTLNVNDNGIEIKASGKGGFLYALQTLKQMLPREYFEKTLQADVEWSVPFLAIDDEPALGHRGYMLDIARHFFDKREVKRILDILALYKMNRLHWHLTDDQGWRIEIPEYPKLTEVGSIRSGSFSNPGDGTQFYDDTEYGRGCWYSQDDLREIVAYAKELNIEIIPEVDLPGHMVAAVTAYPEFSCDSTKSYEVRLAGGISEDVLNIGDDRVIDFLKCVIDNVAAIFPYDYIHIGGDECPTGQWSTNSQCLARVEAEGLSGVEQLQSWLVQELGTYIKETHGKDIVVWDELLSNWNDENTVKPVIMAWNSIYKSSDAASRGFKSIIVPYQTLYLDFMQVEVGQCLVDEIYHGGWGDTWVNTVEEIYTFNPLGALSGNEDYALGVQGNMWTETCNDEIELEYQLLPRLLALSETAWLPNSAKQWGGFYKRMQSQDEILDALGYTYAKHYIEEDEKSDAEILIGEAEYIIENSIRGGVGYPAAELYDALATAIAATDGSDEASIATLEQAIEEYKNADIKQPEAGKTYQIVSASTYYKRQYTGSTMYQKGDKVRFHYTPQTEPEELWQFEAATDGYKLKSVYSGSYLNIETYDAAASMSEGDGTIIRVDKATIATGSTTYIPGVVTLSATDGYSATVTGSVRRVSAEGSGEIFAKDEAALCYNGTWKIIEINDYTEQLQGLVNKCELIILTTELGESGEPTEEALEYLQDNVITPAKETLEAGGVTEQQYNAYTALYHQFQMMERTSLSSMLSEDCYYYIYNIWFGKYAGYDSSTQRISPVAKSSSDNLLWSIKKNNDGTIYIYNKATGTAAYIASDSSDQPLLLGKEYKWSLEERELDGTSGICIIEQSGGNSWYTNPAAWNYVLTKPFWGACTWEFQESGISVETGIGSVTTTSIDDNAPRIFYDLSGRKVTTLKRGIYVTDKGEKIIIKD